MIKQKLKLMVVKVDSFENYRARYKKDLLLLIYFLEEIGQATNKFQMLKQDNNDNDDDNFSFFY